MSLNHQANQFELEIIVKSCTLQKIETMGLFSRKKKEVDSKTYVITDQNFGELVMQAELGVLVDFWAPWCGPCKTIGPIIDELAIENEGRVLIGKVNVDHNPKLSQLFKVKSIPTLVFIKSGRIIEAMSGMVSKPNLQEMIEDLIKFEVIIENEEE